eukprot:g47469.t1
MWYFWCFANANLCELPLLHALNCPGNFDQFGYLDGNQDGLISPTSPDSKSLVRAFSSPTTAFIMDERVQLTTGLQTQERHLFLFSDVLQPHVQHLVKGLLEIQIDHVHWLSFVLLACYLLKELQQ